MAYTSARGIPIDTMLLSKGLDLCIAMEVGRTGVLYVVVDCEDDLPRALHLRSSHGFELGNDC